MAVANPAAPPDARRLTTHVLDTSTGRPAAGLTLQLLRIEGESRTLLTTAATNADGRCDAPLLSGEAMAPGTYEIAFEVGAYFARAAAGEPPSFLDIVPVRFRIAPQGPDGPAHLHVPLLISPYGYSTYRGS
ncbi:hydroxyisourate hydrolase [Methylorubrum extorquens]|uniref:hydroxyisourate hydrolase n=1 Tax=Methylorubrum extorquens TaxID=408 RepID=UPI000158F888|nr:hydroxyisourate hydrolase [Methylorubrum extorquens]ABY30144.1 hydroxyisourate hydrolase [Methylorubrum extorquens PA1]KQP93554.1 5-hydroxyisourate hydrolase [Methylobacterium sp. Leaf119]WIU41450.1 hydroxyisourate hydrolase [Methylorubrum extorquens]